MPLSEYTNVGGAEISFIAKLFNRRSIVNQNAAFAPSPTYPNLSLSPQRTLQPSPVTRSIAGADPKLKPDAPV